VDLTTIVVNGTPSMESVMLGAPERALARITKPLDAGSVTVVDADPADVNASARPPEALLSETSRPEPGDERAIFSSSIGVGVAVALAVALLAAVTGTDMAANLSRRVVISPTAARASAGTAGVLSEAVSATAVSAVLMAGVIEALLTDGDVIVGVADWATSAAGTRRLAEACGADFFPDDDAVPDADDPGVACEEAAACADPEDELEPPVSALASGLPSPVAIAVPIPSATARTPILPTDMLAAETGRVV